MKLLFLTGSNTKFDGRTRELINVAESIGDTYIISNHKLKSYAKFLIDAILMGMKQKNTDIIFADNRKASIPALILVSIIKPKLLIYDARELYFAHESETLASKIGCFFEKKIIEKADIVICANEERKEIMDEHYTLKHPVIVFDNFRSLKYTSDDISNIVDKYKNLFEDNKFTIISTSGCEIGRGTLDMIKAVSELDFESQLLLVGCRDDKERDIVGRIIESEGYDNIIMIPRVGIDELKYLISKSSVGIAMYHQKNLNNKYCSSGKIYEYVYEGVPVATSDNPPLKNFIERHNVGVADSNIKDAIISVYKQYEHFKSQSNALRNASIVEQSQEEFKQSIKKLISENIKS